MDAAFSLAEEALSVERTSMSQVVQEATRSLLADGLVTAIGGLHAPGVGETRHAFAAWSGSGDGRATVWGCGRTASPYLAAMWNAAALHALEFDDTDDAVPLHPSSVVLPVLFAMAEEAGGGDGGWQPDLSGRELLTALAVGLEMTMRIGRAGKVRARRGWNYNAMNGGFGAVLAVARSRRWSVPMTVSALGHQLCQTAGTTQSLVDGVLAKRLQPAFMAKSAVMACALAERGISGPVNVFEGVDGYYALYQDQAYDSSALAPHGETCALVPGVSLKPYPSCRFTHPAIDAALALRQDGLDAGQVESVEVEVGEVAARLVGQQFRPSAATVVDAQFSIPYTASVALLHGSVRLGDFTPEALRRDDVAALAESRFRVIGNPDIPPTSLLPATMTVRLASGEARRYRVETTTGSPEKPMTPEERGQKEADCITGPDAQAWCKELHRCIDQLETDGTLGELAAAVGARR